MDHMTTFINENPTAPKKADKFKPEEIHVVFIQPFATILEWLIIQVTE
jgi:hypothetical protein